MNDTVTTLGVLICGIGFVVLFFGGGGGWLLYVALSGRKKVQASQSWLTTQGKIFSSNINQVTYRDSDGDSTSLQLAVQYDYVVDGVPYSSDRYTLGRLPKGIKPRKTQEILDRYPAGAEVTVYYNPQNPKEACLEREAPLNNLTLILGIVLLVIMLCGCCPLVVMISNAVKELISQ